MLNKNLYIGGRLKQIDILKGIGILTMVIGHAGLPRILTCFIYAFHMPLFFLLNGMTTNFDIGFGSFLKKRSKSLLLPFFVYYIIHVILYGLVFGRGIMGQLIYEVTNRIEDALWFIPVLFISTCIAKLIPSRKELIFIAIVSFATMSELLVMYGVDLPFHLCMTPYGASFILVGRLLSNEIKTYALKQEPVIVSLCVVFISAFVTFGISRIKRLNMYFEQIEPVLPLITGALLGFVMILAMSKVFSKLRLASKFFSYTGRNTLIFVAFSQFVLKCENLFIYDYVIVKYIMLFVFLYVLIFVKDKLPIAIKLKL